MARKKLQSGLILKGIAPNLLLKQVENTAPFLFQGEISIEGEGRKYLKKLNFYKKNIKTLKNLNLYDYFYLCMASHWATAGTFVPTDVDNQIREHLWKHETVASYIYQMGKLIVESWNWIYEDVTNRKAKSEERKDILSTHEGTWLSVAIGGYCALLKYPTYKELLEEIRETILLEISKEEKLLNELREKRDAINFLRCSTLMAHNLGDLNRVIDQWGMAEEPFCQKIYKLGHRLSSDYSTIFLYAGNVNKEMIAIENHRHMSMRGPKCLRKSSDFLIPIGPFMDEWGRALGRSTKLSMMEKGEIIYALFEGHKRQDRALGYIRAFSGLLFEVPEGIKAFEEFLPWDLLMELKSSPFYEKSQTGQKQFEAEYEEQFLKFRCPETQITF